MVCCFSVSWVFTEKQQFSLHQVEWVVICLFHFFFCGVCVLRIFRWKATCVWMYIAMYVHTYGDMRLMLGVFLQGFFILLTEPRLLIWQLSLGISWLHLQRLELQASCHSHKALIWFLEVLALFLKLAQTVTIERLPRLTCINWWKHFTSPSFWAKVI